MPVPPEDWTTQTSAEPEVVPLEVTMGEPELKAKVSLLLPATRNEGCPVPVRPYARATRWLLDSLTYT